jgi:RimJ/RimL family protein N-acetyltransferase
MFKTAGMTKDIFTDRLRLRKSEQKDRIFLKSLFSDEQVVHYVAGSENRAETLIEEMCNKSANKRADKIYWLAERKLDEVHIGYISALRYNTPRVEISFAVSPDFRRCGYGREIVCGLINHLASIPQAEEIIALINSGNTASQKIVESLGFRRCHPLLSVYEKQISRNTASSSTSADAD